MGRIAGLMPAGLGIKPRRDTPADQRSSSRTASSR
jgi:hypothetical protein